MRGYREYRAKCFSEANCSKKNLFTYSEKESFGMMVVKPRENMTCPLLKTINIQSEQGFRNLLRM